MENDSDIENDIYEGILERVKRDDIELNQIIVTASCVAVHHQNSFLMKNPCRDSPHTGWKFIMEILDGHDNRCHEMFRMEKHVFLKLCDRLKSYGLKSTRGIQLEEAVGMFLMTLGHGVGNRMIQERFQHSGETVSRQFGLVLEKMTVLALDEIKPLENYDEVPHYIRSNLKYWPYFKDCIRAIDGTHIRASLPVNEKIPYIGRKGYPTQNIMAVCGFDMLFTFVWPGWEGTAHDTKIFFRAYRDPAIKFPKPPNDKYYLVDAGYPNMKGFLAPYRGERYNLPEFQRGSQPRGSREIFNQAHSSLRSVIERTFGVWKAKWRILQNMPNFEFDKQVAIVSASMALHNFIRKEAIADIEFQTYGKDDYVVNEEIGESDISFTSDDTTEMGVIRDRIATELMLR